MKLHATRALPLALLLVLASGCGSIHSNRDHDRNDNRVYGASAPQQGHELICHKGKKTMSLPSSAVSAHLDHGDRRGSC